MKHVLISMQTFLKNNKDKTTYITILCIIQILNYGIQMPIPNSICTNYVRKKLWSKLVVIQNKYR